MGKKHKRHVGYSERSNIFVIGISEGKEKK